MRMNSESFRSVSMATLGALLQVACFLHCSAVGGFAAVPGIQSKAETETVETMVVRPGIEPGLGAEHRSRIVQAQELVMANRVPEAEKILQEIIGAIDEKLRTNDRIRVCVATRAEFDRFAADHGGAAKVQWVDWAYREAIQTQAYIAAGSGDLERALVLLERVEVLGPYEAGPLVERGFVLNKLGRSKDALESYRRAYDLSQRFESARPLAPAALRGIGFSLIELGDLKAARTAFEDSLKLEPNNPNALQELDYIRSLETKSP